MRHSLHAHIIYLENSIQDAKARLAKPGLTPEDVEDLQLQLTLAESALEHYRQAYSLELSLAGSEPPNSPAASQSNGGKEKLEKAKTKNKEGLAAIEARLRKRAARAGRLYCVPQQSAHRTSGSRPRGRTFA